MAELKRPIRSGSITFWTDEKGVRHRYNPDLDTDDEVQRESNEIERRALERYQALLAGKGLRSDDEVVGPNSPVYQLAIATSAGFLAKSYEHARETLGSAVSRLYESSMSGFESMNDQPTIQSIVVKAGELGLETVCNSCNYLA